MSLKLLSIMRFLSIFGPYREFVASLAISLALAGAFQLGMLSAAFRQKADSRSRLLSLTDQVRPMHRVCLAVNGSDNGSTRCGLADPGWDSTSGHDVLPLMLFQLYHAPDHHESLYDCSHPLYRGLAQTADIVRPGSDDVDASEALPLLQNVEYQNNLCEYSGLFGLLAGGHLDSMDRPYVGFQSWKANHKAFGLTCGAEVVLVNKIQRLLQQGQEGFFYWVGPGKDFMGGLHNQFYFSCEWIHGPHCISFFRDTFSEMFNGNNETVTEEGLENGGLPSMPGMDETWALMSYFALPVPRLHQYLRFAALFFSILASNHQNMLFNSTLCPIKNPGTPEDAEYGKTHCFCYIMERLVNIWVYHTGMRFFHLHPASGRIDENHPAPSRSTFSWFTDGGVERAIQAMLDHGGPRNNQFAKNLLTQLLRSKRKEEGGVAGTPPASSGTGPLQGRNPSA